MPPFVPRPRSAAARIARWPVRSCRTVPPTPRVAGFSSRRTALHPRPELLRRREEMADRALPAGEMRALLRVAGETERAGRDQHCDAGRRVTVPAAGMRGAAMRGVAVSAVALAAIPRGRMVLVMARGAAAHAIGRHDVGRPVAVRTGQPAVALVAESHRAVRRRPGANPDLYHTRYWLGERFRAMAARTIGRHNFSREHALVMAKVAAPGRLEHEARAGPIDA